MLLRTLVMLLNNGSWNQMGNFIQMTILTAAIPQTSKNKGLAWELHTILVDSKISTPRLEQNGFLPTQKSLGSVRSQLSLIKQSSYYNNSTSMILTGHARFNVSEYPQKADHTTQAIEDVYNGIKEPKQALDDANAKCATGLG